MKEDFCLINSNNKDRVYERNYTLETDLIYERVIVGSSFDTKNYKYLVCYYNNYINASFIHKFIENFVIYEITNIKYGIYKTFLDNYPLIIIKSDTIGGLYRKYKKIGYSNTKYNELPEYIEKYYNDTYNEVKDIHIDDSETSVYSSENEINNLEHAKLNVKKVFENEEDLCSWKSEGEDSDSDYVPSEEMSDSELSEEYNTIYEYTQYVDNTGIIEEDDIIDEDAIVNDIVENTINNIDNSSIENSHIGSKYKLFSLLGII